MLNMYLQTKIIKNYIYFITGYIFELKKSQLLPSKLIAQK